MTTDDDEIDAILVAALGRVGRPVNRGAGAGARWTAKRLRTETASEHIEVPPTSVGAVLDRLAEVLHAPVDVADDGSCRVRGLIGSGVGGLNPAYVMVMVGYLTGQVDVAAYAKEGLIKQHTAEKAVRRILEEVRTVG